MQNMLIYSICLISPRLCELVESGPFHHQILTELHFKTFTECLLLGGQFESKMTQNMDQLLIYLKCDGKTDIKQAIILQEVQQCCTVGFTPMLVPVIQPAIFATLPGWPRTKRSVFNMHICFVLASSPL